MPCKGCGDKTSDRYTPRTVGQPAAEEGRPEHTHAHTQETTTPPYEELYAEVNTYSLNTLISMTADVRIDEEAKYKEMLKYMSDDLKALKIITFVKVYNGEEFSKEGHTSEYCIEMLYQMLNYDGTSKLFDRFPGLAEQVEKKHADLKSRRILLKIK